MFSFDSALVFIYTLSMKTVLSLIIMFLLPFSAIAHPGKTDYRGGHKCWKNCGEWELRHGEYHLHDKDWNPIRFGQKGDVVEADKPEGVPIPEKRFLLEEPATVAPENSGTKIPDQHVVVEKHQMLTVYEESVMPLNTILLILLAVLMLIVLIFLRRKREKE